MSKYYSIEQIKRLSSKEYIIIRKETKMKKEKLITYLKQMADFCDNAENYGLEQNDVIGAKAQAKFAKMLVRTIEGGSFDEE